jgi:hypothetical protein
MATVSLTACRDEKLMDTPLSESSVSLKLEEIRRRCSELMDEPDALLELSLEDPVAEPESDNSFNPYGS